MTIKVTKMRGNRFENEKAMQLLLGVKFATCNTKKRGEQGSILLFFIPWILLLFLLVLGLFYIGTHVQNAIALESRLDICALQTIHSRMRLFQSLSESNAMLHKIQITIDAIRGTKVIPIIGELSTLGEPALLSLAKLIKLAQEQKIIEETIKESSQLICRKNKFSAENATCLFTPITLAQLYRESTLFPDVPGRISLLNAQQILAVIRCQSMFSSKLYQSSIALLGDPKLFERNFTYAYE